MGEQAELILNGDVCEGCGEEMGDGSGYPRRCSSCGGSDDDVSDGEFYKAASRERRQSLEPQRFEYAKKQLYGHEFDIIKDIRIGGDKIEIYLTKNRQIDFWPYTGWFCGRKPIGKIKGRGIENLIKELKCLSI